MTKPFSTGELAWWQRSEPTSEELRLSGGLLVEDWPHARQVVRLSAQLFEATRALHQLDERALRLLERAACVARYHRRALPSTSHEEFAALSRAARKRVSALAALLRIADAFDYSHDGRLLRLAAEPELCDEHNWTISLWVRPLADLDDELEHAYEKADLFEKVFKRKLQFLIQD